jgi:chitodextrinase
VRSNDADNQKLSDEPDPALVAALSSSAADALAPVAPTTLAWSNAGDKVTLAWNASTDDVGVIAYDLYLGSVFIGAFDEPSVSLVGFRPGTPYDFTVRARDAAGNVSAPSNQVTVLLGFPRDTTPPTAPTTLTAFNVSSTSMKLSWTASIDDVKVVVYQVYAGRAVVATTIGTTSAAISGLTPGATYSFTVKAFDAANNVSAASAALSVTTHRLDGWTFYGSDQGLSEDIQDVSTDEAGNVYVAGGDAVYAKARAAQRFLRFDHANAGLTQNCNDPDQYTVATPPKPFYTCPVISVAGAAPGKAIIGFDMFKLEMYERPLWADWPIEAGGADVVAFDPAAGTLTRVRHVRVASPPHTICATATFYGRVTSCPDPYNYWWFAGRRLVARIVRIVVNHDTASPLYGDAWMGCQHATFAALLANAEARGLVDRTAGLGPEWVDAKDVWEHEHMALSGPLPGQDWVNGEGWALSIAPDGTIWGSNEYRTTFLGGYGADLSILNNPGAPDQDSDFWMNYPYLDLWPDPPDDYRSSQADAVRSMSHCPDGTLWIGSLTHGLARRAPDGSITYLSLPDPAMQDGVSAVACDPSDGSVWIGLAQVGGVLRYRGGVFERAYDPAGLPAFASHPPRSIQIDRWSSPRVVYFALTPDQDETGAITSGGGVAAYDGP